MKTIIKNVKNELEIKNSKFITLLIKVKEKEEVVQKLQKAKELYPKANPKFDSYTFLKKLFCLDIIWVLICQTVLALAV